MRLRLQYAACALAVVVIVLVPAVSRKAFAQTSALAGADAQPTRLVTAISPDVHASGAFAPAIGVRFTGEPGPTPNRPDRFSPAAGAPLQNAEAVEESARRKGFIIGVGAGPAVNRASRFSGSDSAFAVVTDFRVGYAPSDQLLLHYSNKVAWTRDARYDFVGVTGFGTTYMMKRSSPSAFVTGAIGGGVGGDLLGGAESAGYGFSAGGGYEFARHFSFDGEAMFIRLGGSNNHVALRAGFNYLFY